LHCIAGEEKGRWRLLERGEAERNPEGIVAAQGRPDGGRHRPFPVPALVPKMAQKPWIVSIPGTRNIDHLNENLGAINVQLTPADLSKIEPDFSRITVHGGRMNEEQMKVVDQTV